MKLNEMKLVVEAAIEYIQFGDVVGVGTGSTANMFIDFLPKVKNKLDGTVASSESSAELLRSHGMSVLDLNQLTSIPLYVDSTDEATRHRHLMKGGGGALTREKILAQASEKFVCIAERSKLVGRLGGGTCPLTIEVIPLAQSQVAKEMIKLGGIPELRTGFTTDNGNIILDVKNLNITHPIEMEKKLNHIPGVVTVGIFALRGADILILGSDIGVEKIK